MSERKPFISVVLAVRNDNYGGDFHVRLQNMIAWNAAGFIRARIPVEFLLVNYNPIPDQSSLTVTLTLPKSELVKFRMVTVPPEVHAKLVNPEIRETVPLFEYIAKNAGIRRAEGEFILVANPDILIHPKIFSRLTPGRLDPSCYYRCDRADFKNAETKLLADTSRALAEINSRVFRVFLKGKTWDVQPGSFNPLRLMLLRWRNRSAIRRDAWLGKHEDYANRKQIPVNYDDIVNRYHCNCSGDFMLMNRDAWLNLGAYPEQTRLSIHTDALFVIMAAVSGLNEVVFPQPIYHQDHERRYSGERAGKEKEMFDWFVKEGEWMEENQQVKIYNPDGWGLNSFELPDESLGEFPG